MRDSTTLEYLENGLNIFLEVQKYSMYNFVSLSSEKKSLNNKFITLLYERYINLKVNFQTVNKIVKWHDFMKYIKARNVINYFCFHTPSNAK